MARARVDLAVHWAARFGQATLRPDSDRPQGWLLEVDGVPQSYVDLDDPTHLEFEYVRMLGDLLDLAAPPGDPLTVLHLGGGGCTLARYVAATRPGSTQTVVELDGPLAEFVAHRLPADGMGIDVTVGDARAALTSNGASDPASTTFPNRRPRSTAGSARTTTSANAARSVAACPRANASGGPSARLTR